MSSHICPWSQFGEGGGLKRGDEINSLSEAENNSIAGSLLASQMLRRLQDQQLPSAPHRRADDKLKLRHQCLDGRARGVGGGGQEDQMSGRVGWRGGDENRWDGVWRWKGKVRDEKIRRAENDQEVGRRWGAEEAKAAGEETGGEEAWMWDRYIHFLWAISPGRNARRRKWAADKGKCVSLRFGQLWIGQEEFLWETFRGEDYTDETSMLPCWFCLGSGETSRV